MFGRKLAVVCLGVLGSIWMSGCGGSSPAVGVAVTAAVGTVDGGDTTTLTATVSNDQNSAGVTWTVSGGGALSNTTTSGATYTAPAASSSALSVTVTATSVADATKSATATISVPAAPSITTTALMANVGAAFGSTLAATGGISPYTWALTQGTLPAGWSVTTAGVVSGPAPVAGQAGSINLTFGLTDSGTPTALTASQQVMLTINPAPAITFTGVVPATATYNVAFTGSSVATGGAGALTYSLFAGSLPTGLLLNTATGAITGTPTAAGTFPFTVKAADAFGDSATKAYSIVSSYPALTITSGVTLPIGYVGTSYDQFLTASGGSGTGYSWVLKSGSSLPAGLTLSSAGEIKGKPTASGPNSFTVDLTDSASNAASATFSLTVNPGVSITTGLTLPTGYAGSHYSKTLAATGGSGSGYTWSLASGSTLPGGLTLSSAGVLSGTPTTAGTPSFSITVTDSASNTATAIFSMTISPGVTISPVTPPVGYPGTAYTATTLAATGGSGTGYTWSWAAASGSTLPAGLSISAGGVITGTPTNSTATSVVSSVVVMVSDSVGNQATLTVSVTIEATVAVATASLPGATVGANYSQTLAAAGGSGTYTSWQVTTGGASLTAIGLSLNTATGVISGASPTAGTANFTVAVTDSQGHVSAAASFTVTASSVLTVTTATLNPLNVGQTPTQIMTAAGGSGIIADYSWSWTASGGSSLPPGLSMGANGAIAGSPTATGTYNAAVKVQDSGSSTSATAILSITIYPALTLSPNSALPAGYTGVVYNGSIAATSGSGSYCYKVPTAAQYVAGIWDGLQTALPNSAGACNYIGSSLFISGTPTNPPVPPYTISFSIPVTDLTTGQTISQFYSISVTAPPAPSLPASSLAPATVSQTYSGSITATGGIGPAYVWTINGAALAIDGTPVSIGDGLSVSNNGTDVLSISGSPTSVSASPGVQFTAQVKDDTTGLTSGAATTYTIVVNSSGSQVSGQISLMNSCGVTTLPTFAVSINTSPVQNTTTDGSGNYSFSNVANGTYTITPSIAGAESVFSPATQTNIVVNNGSITGKNFTASVGYTVSGNVTYAGTKTGQVYLVLNSTNCGGDNQVGTSISESTLTSGGAFLIRGVPTGSYTLQTWMDPLGQGASNAVDPAGNSSVTVSSANVTGAAVTLTDPTVTTPITGPPLYAISPMNLGVAISFNALTDSNGVETVGGYTVQWSTSSTFSSTGSYSFAANGTNANVWILNNSLSGMTSSFANGTAYYFRARGELANGTIHTPWTVYGGGTPTAVTIGAPSGAGYFTVSGAVTLPAGVTLTGPLYVGFFNQSTGSVFATYIASPSNSSSNAYTVSVPNTAGSYYFFGIVDQNKNGLIDAGDLTNTRGGGNANTVTISGNTTGENETLSGSAGTIAAITQFYQNSQPGGSGSGYNIGLNIRQGYKLPVSVTLTAASNQDMILPIDIGACGNDCGNPQWQYYAPVGGTPHVGDTYTFSVTYSDGTTANLIGTLTGWNGTTAIVGAGDLVTNLAPTVNSSTSLTPTFTWTYPANASALTYNFYIFSGTNGTIWQVPSNNSNLDGFPSTVPDIVWGTDPTGDGSNTPTLGSLTSGVTYYWQIQAQDSNGNQAQTQVYYIP